MKKFYTFGPQKFHFFSKMRNFLAMALMLLLAVGNVKAEEVTIVFGEGTGEIHATSGTINDYLSFTTARNGGSTNPAYNAASEELRLYYSSTGNGGSLTLNCLGGITITGIEITASGSAYTPTVKYKVDGGTAVTASRSGVVYSISGVNATSNLMFQNANTANTQLRIKTIKVVYSTPCQEVTELASENVTATGAGLKWKSNSADFIAQLDGTDISSFTFATSGDYKTYTAEGLTPNAEHTFAIKATCEADYHTVTFTTECNEYNIPAEVATIPEGETYTWGGESYTESGNYVQTLYDQYGCDSVLTLNLTVVSNVYTITPTTCMGFPYTNPYTNEVMYDGSDIDDIVYINYSDTLPNAAFGGTMDSIRVINLTVSPEYVVTDTRDICINELPFDIQNYHFEDLEAGTYDYNLHLMSQYDCDSTVRFTLNVHPMSDITVDATFCSNELPAHVGEIEIPATATTGVITQTFASAFGCDSTVHVNLTVYQAYPDEVVEETVCDNALPYTWRGHTFAEAVTDTVFTETTVNGCDSIVTFSLSVNPTYNEEVPAVTICASELPYDFRGHSLTEANTYTYNETTVAGCDSIVTFTLNVNPTYNEEVPAVTICDSELPYNFRGHELTEADTYIYNETTVNGCDSIVTFTLNVAPTYNETIEETICDSELPYNFRGHNLTEAGTYTYNETTANGCDSIVTYTLNVNPTYNETDAVTICVNELPYTYNAGNGHTTVFPVGTTTQDTALVYATALGCDSVVNLTLTVNSTDMCSFEITLEAGENGTITGATTVNHGANETYTITPASDCYYISSLTLDGVAQTITTPEGMTLDLDSIVAHHTIAASFEVYTYTLTSSVDGEGTITATSVVDCGSDTTFAITPADGYHLDSVVVDGVNQGVIDTYTFTNVHADGNIIAYFSINHYTINMVVNGANGTVDPVGDLDVVYGATPAYTFVPATCYELSSLLIDGEEVVDDVVDNVYTFPAVDANHSAVATFDHIMYPITVNNTGNGVGTVNGLTDYPVGDTITSVTCGTAYFFNMMAGEGSHISDFTWGGGTMSFDGQSQKTFQMWNGSANATNNTITVTFNLDTMYVTSTVQDNIGGTVDPANGWIEYGQDFTLNITADAANGYHIQTITTGSNVVTLGNNEDINYAYVLQNVTSDTSIVVEFALNTYEITVNGVGNGTIVPGTLQITHGEDTVCTFTAADCYFIDSVVVDGVNQGAIATYAFNDVDANHTVTAYFTIQNFTMTGIANTTDGTVTSGTADCGTDYTYNIEATTEGYHIDHLELDGTTVETYTANETTATYTVSDVRDNHTLEAFFAINEYPVTATAINGMVTPANASVAHGGSQTFTLVPDFCQELTALTVNGEDYMANTTAVPANVTEVFTEDFSGVTDASTNQQCDASTTAFNAARFNAQLPGWSGTNVYGANGKVKLSSGSAAGTLTRTFDLSANGGHYTIEFDAKAWARNGESTTMEVVVGSETHQVTGLSTATGCELSHFVVEGDGGTASTQVTFRGIGANSRFFLDNITISVGLPASNTVTVSNITDTTEIEAVFSPIQYTMDYTTTGEGTVTPDATTADCGSTFTYHIEAAEGWHIDNYTIGGTTTTLGTNADVTADVEVFVESDTTLDVVFAINGYTVTVNATTGQGSFDNVAQNNTYAVEHGDNQTINIAADSVNGYHIASITCGSDEVELGNNTDLTYAYTITNIVSDTTVDVEFALNEYPITVTLVGNGSVAPATQDWEYGDDATFVIEPAEECYYIDSIIVDGSEAVITNVQGMNFTIANVVEPHTLHVVFADSVFQMTKRIYYPYMGTVSEGEAHCGGSYDYEIHANEGYHISSISLDYATEPAIDSLRIADSVVTVTDIHANHHMIVDFALNTYDVTVSANEFGTITPDGDLTPSHGDVLTFTLAAMNPCHELVTLTLNDEDVTDQIVADQFTWTADTDAVIVATFAPIMYAMDVVYDPASTGLGTVNAGTVECDSTYQYNIVANHGSHIESYTLNGVTTTLGTNDDTLATVDIVAASQDTTLTVLFAINTYNVTLCTLDPAEGSMTAVTATATYGNPYDVTVRANYVNGYHVETITCGDSVATYGANIDTVINYTINSITSDTTVCATFELNEYTITATAGDNGTIEVAGENTIVWGSDTSFVITPAECYYIDVVTVDGTEISGYDTTGFTYPFTNVVDNHTIDVQFAIYTYNLASTVNDATMGTVTSDPAVNCGDAYDYVINAAHGYHIDSIYLDGAMNQSFTYSETNYDTTYTVTINPVDADHVLDAFFSINTYTMHAENGANGTIDPVGDSVLNHGETIVYTVTPDDCYYISEVLVDDVDVLADDSTAFTYTFADVQEPHTIVANFAIYEYEMAETHTGNGTVSTATVNCGDTYTYTITADQGWHIEEYTIAGATVHFGTNDDNTATYVISPARQDTSIDVVFAIDTFDVTVCTADGGTLVVNPAIVDYGSSCDVTITADTVNGYHIQTITCGSDEVTLGQNSDVVYTYTLNSVTSDTTICATFELNNYTITATADANSNITPAGVTNVRYGDTLAITMTSNVPCYYITNYEVDGVATTVNDSVAQTYTFEFITADHTIDVYSAIYTYNLASTVNDATMGSVTSDDSVDCGTDYNYLITANYGYHLEAIYLDGVLDQTFPYSETLYTTAFTRTVTNVMADHQLDAVFAINTYTIDVTVGANGSVEPGDDVTLNHGDNATFVVTPDPCYYISEVLVDGTDVLGADSTTFTYTFTNVVAPHTFEANFAIYEYEMTETHTGMGTVSTATVNCGDDYTYMIDADTANGYHIESVTFNGVTTTYGNNEDIHAEQLVEAVSQDTTIDIVFAINTYSIDVTVNGNGTTTPGDTAGIIWDTNVDYTITAEHGYHIASVLADGVNVFTPSSDPNIDSLFNYSFTNIRENHTLVVNFATNIYTIIASADSEGTIVMPGENHVAYNNNIDFTITANGCYHISAILIDGVESVIFDDNTSYYVFTFENVEADHTIHATFAINTYTIHAAAGANGTITPAGDTTVDCGANVVYTFTPDAGYAIEGVVVNGNNIGAPTTYTVTDIHSDYDIMVTFTDINYTLTSSSFGHGTITPEGTTLVAENGTQVYTLVPDDCYTVSEVLVDGVSYLNELEDNTLTLDSIQSDMNIQAYFQIKTYNVTTTAAEGGFITEGGVVNCGSDVELTITADACHNIDSVVVNGVNAGAVETYTISAIDTDYTVAAYFSIKTYTITSSVNDTVMGTITATDTFDCGETPTYEITPNDGYYIVDVTVDGVSQGIITSYTFGSLDADHTIDAEFAMYTYTLTATANVGVTSTPALGDTVVDYNASVTYTFTVDSCYEIADVLVDGVSMGAITTYTFDSITADHIIAVNAVVKTYTITSSVSDVLGGTVTPLGETTVNCGGSQNYTVTVNEGYVIEDVLVNGTSVGVVNSYFFENVTGDSTIEVVFHALAVDSFQIVASVRSGNGTINPAGTINVARGASQTFTMIPDEFYRVFEVYVDGVLATTSNTYTFGNVSDNHTIEVVFVPATCPVPTYAWTEDIDYTSATLNWTDMNVTSYTVRYKKASDTSDFIEVTGITDNFYELSGLDMNTDYIWNVKSVCIADEAESNWSSQQTFRTLEDISSDTTGIYEMTLGEMNVYSYGNDIYVVNNSQEQIKDIQVYDLMGRVVFAGKAQSNPQVINVNAANGTYVVRVVTENAIRNYKVSISQR